MKVIKCLLVSSTLVLFLSTNTFSQIKLNAGFKYSVEGVKYGGINTLILHLHSDVIFNKIFTAELVAGYSTSILIRTSHVEGFETGIFLRGNINEYFYITLPIIFHFNRASTEGKSLKYHKKNFTFFGIGMGFKIGDNTSIESFIFIPDDKKLGERYDYSTYPPEHVSDINMEYGVRLGLSFSWDVFSF